MKSLVRPELKEQFQNDRFYWFPRNDTHEHKAYDKRTPDLFKEVWSGDGIIGLVRLIIVLGHTTNSVVKA